MKELGPDMTAPCGDGFLNLRVGAIIVKNGKVLMVKNDRADYCYSVGGRIRMGENAEQAIVREVFEETGRMVSIEHLGFVHELYFIGDSPSNLGKPIYELSFYFYMRTPDDFEPVCESFAEGNAKERLVWLDPCGKEKYYPSFMKDAVLNPVPGMVHVFTDDR